MTSDLRFAFRGFQKSPGFALTAIATLALGAQRGAVLSLVVGQGLRLAGAGIAIGLLLAGVLSRTVESQLFGVAELDPITFGSMALVLLGAAFLASYLPARRATKVDPLHALRYE
jgi:ABC-type antimicrobial peptide transport system permease subunit